MLPSFTIQNGKTVTRLRPGVKTQRGSQVPDWSNVERLEISGCSVQPAGTALSQDGRVLGVSDGYTVYMPPNTDVQAGDRIVYDGDTYTIDGRPRRWKSATGRLDHIMISIERWTG